MTDRLQVAAKVYLLYLLFLKIDILQYSYISLKIKTLSDKNLKEDTYICIHTHLLGGGKLKIFDDSSKNLNGVPKLVSRDKENIDETIIISTCMKHTPVHLSAFFLEL